MVLERQDLGASPAMKAAYELALAAAQTTAEQLRYLDLYSCFPIAVFAAIEALGIAADDPRGLTLTGGLPYFGGPGNNYSMHAVVELVQRLRADPGSCGLIGANGGLLSTHAVGVYSTTPRPWQGSDCHAAQARINALPTPAFTREPEGWASVESYTITHTKQGPAQVTLVGRLDASGERFIAINAAGAPGDASVPAALTAFTQGEPFGLRVWVDGHQGRNVFALSARAMHEHAAQ